MCIKWRMEMFFQDTKRQFTALTVLICNVYTKWKKLVYKAYIYVITLCRSGKGKSTHTFKRSVISTSSNEKEGRISEAQGIFLR